MSEITLTPAQCRAARALLGISQADLAEMSGVSRVPLANFESGKTQPYLRSLSALRDALEAAGVVFIEDGAASAKGGGPGVRLR